MVLFVCILKNEYVTAFIRLEAAPILTPASKLCDGLTRAPEVWESELFFSS